MDVAQTILAIINAATLVLVAIINSNGQKSKKKEEERYQQRLKNEKLSIDLTKNNCHLSILVARKIAGEHINGDLEKAISETEQAYDSYVAFTTEEFAKAISQF